MSDRKVTLLERLTDDLGHAERYEIEFAQVAKDDLKQVLELLEAAALEKEGVVEELVERVALALFHSDKPFAKTNNLIPTSNELEPWRYSARAAIAALPAPVSVQEQKT